jgi:lysophospholipase L1-like esterase
MNQSHLILFYLALILILFICLIFGPGFIPMNKKPTHDDEWWNEMFSEQNNKIAKGECNLFLTGDSITMRFETTAPKAWERYIVPNHPINFGIDGDETEDLQYRLKNAPLEKITPNVCTILIGVNDILNGETPEIVAEQIHEITKYLATQYPTSKVLLFQIFPAEYHPSQIRKRIDRTNEIISGLNYPKNVKIITIHHEFLNPDGTLNDAILPDQLHISKKGYDIWGKIIHEMIVNQT